MSIYGGRTYDGTSFIFDKIYNNKKEMDEDISNIFVGRYVLIKYCEEPIYYARRIQLESGIAPINNNEINYINNFRIDNNISYDRNVYRAAWVNNEIVGENITNLNNNVDIDDINAARITWIEF